MVCDLLEYVICKCLSDTISQTRSLPPFAVFGNGHPSQYQEGGRPNKGDRPTGLAKEGNVSRGGTGGAFDAVGGRDASSGRKKDHLKSDLFGRETHNTPASTVPAPPPAVG